MQADQSTNPYPGYPARWADRFAFFDLHGRPGTRAYKGAIRAASFMERIKFGQNLLAFIFGPIYLLVLGLWRTALMTTVLALTSYALLTGLAMSMTSSTAIDFLSRMVGLAVAWVCSCGANYRYYQKEIKREPESWNVFKNLG